MADQIRKAINKNLAAKKRTRILSAQEVAAAARKRRAEKARGDRLTKKTVAPEKRTSRPAYSYAKPTSGNSKGKTKVLRLGSVSPLSARAQSAATRQKRAASKKK